MDSGSAQYSIRLKLEHFMLAPASASYIVYRVPTILPIPFEAGLTISSLFEVPYKTMGHSPQSSLSRFP